MNYLQKALTEYLSGLTTKKNEKEIWTKDACNRPITIEPVDDENYIVRHYYKNGNLWWEEQWKNGLRHGISKKWDENGALQYKETCENGTRLVFWKSELWHKVIGVYYGTNIQ